MCVCVCQLGLSLASGSEYWLLLFDRACPLTRDPFLIKPPLPNPPSRLKPSPHLSSIHKIKKNTVRRCTRSLYRCLYSVTLPPFFLLHPTISTLPSPSLSRFSLYQWIYTLDTKDLTSNELGNPFSHFWLPIPQLCFFFFKISEEAKRREAHRHRVAFVRLPSGPWCPGGRYHRETARGDQTGGGKESRYLAPEDAPWHSQLNQLAHKNFFLAPSIKIIYPGTVAFLKAHRCFSDGACPLNFKALYSNQGRGGSAGKHRNRDSYPLACSCLQK